MKTSVAAVLVLLAILSPSLVFSKTPEPSLEERLIAIEKIDEELLRAEQELKVARDTQGRRRLEREIQTLQEKQQKLLRQLEEIVGPLPPSVRTENSSPTEERLKAQEKRHETILENDAKHRLP